MTSAARWCCSVTTDGTVQLTSPGMIWHHTWQWWKGSGSLTGDQSASQRSTRSLILDLCAGSGAWSQPYMDAEYEVIRVTWPDDVRLIEKQGASVRGILAAPPCTVFANSGARWPRTEAQMIEALSVV